MLKKEEARRFRRASCNINMKFIDYLNTCLQNAEFKKYWEEDINKQITELLNQSIKSTGVINVINVSCFTYWMFS